MGLLDALLGRSKPAAANLDKLFALPAGQITLQVTEQAVPTGQAAVCFKPAVGQSFSGAEQEIADLLALDDSNSSATVPASAGVPPPATPAAGTSEVSPAPPSKTVRAALTSEADQYGYRWIVLDADDFETLVTRAHFVNSTLDEHGWSSQLLCSVFGFGPPPKDAPDAGSTTRPASLYLVYLYKRGTFYPFVPIGGERRDSEAELRLQQELAGDLPIEPDLSRWFPVWNLPLR
ncbi:MAG TPA: hypothetical protein VMD59_00380 [Acidimicrobiales bacterium]|nr:hypothetical protein [Acidimicrobiales bacterium]